MPNYQHDMQYVIDVSFTCQQWSSFHWQNQMLRRQQREEQSKMLGKGLCLQKSKKIQTNVSENTRCENKGLLCSFTIVMSFTVIQDMKLDFDTLISILYITMSNFLSPTKKVIQSLPFITDSVVIKLLGCLHPSFTLQLSWPCSQLLLQKACFVLRENLAVSILQACPSHINGDLGWASWEVSSFFRINTKINLLWFCLHFSRNQTFFLKFWNTSSFLSSYCNCQILETSYLKTNITS